MKLKRLFALFAVIILVGIYAATLIFSLSGSPNAPYLFKASVFCTAVIPVLLYSYMAIFRFFNRKDNKKDNSEKE